MSGKHAKKVRKLVRNQKQQIYWRLIEEVQKQPRLKRWRFCFQLADNSRAITMEWKCILLAAGSVIVGLMPGLALYHLIHH